MMKKKLVLLVLAYVLLTPASAEASQLFHGGWCVVTEGGRVSLVGRASGYSASDYEVVWVFRYRPVDATTWWDGEDVGYRTSLDVIRGGNFTARFRSLPADAEGMVYRLDILTNEGYLRFDRVAFYNDSTMTVEDCRHPA